MFFLKRENNGSQKLLFRKKSVFSNKNKNIILKMKMVTRKFFLLVIAIAFAIAVNSVKAIIPEHEVLSIPDYPPLLSRMFSGYLNVTSSIDGETREMFYWFIYSQGDPTKDPVFFATSNGPGCSADSYLHLETGPYTIRLGGTWTLNNYTYMKRVSGLYVDMPGGVGFSNDFELDGTEWNDDLTADLNYLFLRQWYDRYPEFKSNTLYINGISYTGHYTPTLAYKILNGPDTALLNRMNGYLIGSPCIGTGFTDGPLADLDWCFTSGSNADPTLPIWFKAHSYEPYDTNLRAHPDPQRVGDPPWDYSIRGMDVYWMTAADGYYCEDFLNVSDDPGDKGGVTAEGEEISFYTRVQRMRQKASARSAKRHLRQLEKQKQEKDSRSANTQEMDSSVQTGNTNTMNQRWKLPIAPYDPCNGEYLATWLRRADVQAAIHAKLKFGNVWMDCRDPDSDFTYPTPNTTVGMKMQYNAFFAQTNWRIMVVSGTEEVSVNFIQTQQTIASFGRPNISNYSPWYYPDPNTGLYSQMGGWYVNYDKISWASIIGAGHSAAMTSPAKMYQLLVSFLDNNGRAGIKPVLLNESVTNFYGLMNPDGKASCDSDKKEKGAAFGPTFGAGFGTGAGVTFVLWLAYFLFKERQHRNNHQYFSPSMAKIDGGDIPADDDNIDRNNTSGVVTIKKEKGYKGIEETRQALAES
jgi:serine carboxypeptidase-like clade I